MHKRVVYIVVLLLLGWTSGCDSSNDRSDAEIFVGTWPLINLLLDGQNVLGPPLFDADVEIIFESDGTFTLTVVNTDGTTTTISGTYQLDESRKTLTLNSSSFAQAVTVNYEIENDNRIVLDSDDIAVLSEIAGIDLAGLGLQVETVTLIIQRGS